MQIEHPRHDVEIFPLDNSIALHSVRFFRTVPLELGDYIARYQNIVGAGSRSAVSRNHHNVSNGQPFVRPGAEVAAIRKTARNNIRKLEVGFICFSSKS